MLGYVPVGLVFGLCHVCVTFFLFFLKVGMVCLSWEPLVYQPLHGALEVIKSPKHSNWHIEFFLTYLVDYYNLS